MSDRDNKLFLQCSCHDVPVPQPQGSAGEPQEQLPVQLGPSLQHKGMLLGHVVTLQPAKQCLHSSCDFGQQRKGTRATLRSDTSSQSSLPSWTTWRGRNNLLITLAWGLGSQTGGGPEVHEILPIAAAHIQQPLLQLCPAPPEPWPHPQPFPKPPDLSLMVSRLPALSDHPVGAGLALRNAP